MCVRSHWHRILQQPSLSFCCPDAPVICKSIRSRASCWWKMRDARPALLTRSMREISIMQLYECFECCGRSFLKSKCFTHKHHALLSSCLKKISNSADWSGLKARIMWRRGVSFLASLAQQGFANLFHSKVFWRATIIPSQILWVKKFVKANLKCT